MTQDVVERTIVKALLPTLTVLLVAASAPAALAGDPDCFGPEHWAASMAFVYLKDAGIANNDQLDFTKTKTERLASEKIGRDLYRQIQLVTFRRKDGRALEAVTVSDASSDECSMGNVQVFVVSQKLGVSPRSPKQK